MSHYQGSADHRRKSSQASEARGHRHKHHHSESDHDHGSEHRHRQYAEPAPEPSTRPRESVPRISEEDMNYGREVASHSNENYLLWGEDVIKGYRDQIEIMVAQNYTEKCQKIIYDELTPLMTELLGTPDHLLAPETEARIMKIMRLAPYAERQRLKAENCYLSATQHSLHSVGSRERLLARSLKINQDCETLRVGLRMWRDRRGG